jgi:hypothetical protein
MMLSPYLVFFFFFFFFLFVPDKISVTDTDIRPSLDYNVDGSCDESARVVLDDLVFFFSC